MSVPKVKHVRASVVRGGGGDYHDVEDGHWIDDHVRPLWPATRSIGRAGGPSGINVLGTLVVEVEADDGTTGFAITTAGEPGAFIVEKHLARFVVGGPITDIERAWDQMYFSTQYYGRRGIVVNAISAVDLALWDLLAKWRKEPVQALLRGPVRDELVFYATGARPDIAHRRHPRP
jgi:L-rhamnonate dehydratase